MKLAEGYITHQTPDDQIMVTVGEATKKFYGLVRSNETAAFIIDLLKQDTTQEAIVDAMVAEYDAPRETIAADVAGAIETLRGIGAIED